MLYEVITATQALVWQEQGGELLHLVDLDGAFAGVPRNRDAIRSIIEAVSIPTERNNFV